MDHDRLKGRWKLLRGALLESWGTLIADPRVVDEARRLQRAGRVQERYGFNKEQAQHQLDEFVRRNRHWQLPGR